MPGSSSTNPIDSSGTPSRLAPDPTYLVDLKAVTGYTLGTGQTKVNAHGYLKAITLNVSGGTESIEYDLNKQWNYFLAGQGDRVTHVGRRRTGGGRVDLFLGHDQGLISVPVNVYTTVETERKDVAFTTVCAGNGTPHAPIKVNQQYHCPTCKTTGKLGEFVKGRTNGDGTYGLTSWPTWPRGSASMSGSPVSIPN
jgi:hypothetical protein